MLGHLWCDITKTEDHQEVGLVGEKPFFTKNFRYLKWMYWTLFPAIFGEGFPLHKPYPYSKNIGEDSSILGTSKVWWILQFAQTPNVSTGQMDRSIATLLMAPGAQKSGQVEAWLFPSHDVVTWVFYTTSHFVRWVFEVRFPKHQNSQQVNSTF